MSLPLPLALALVAAEWLLVGWVAGQRWPGRRSRAADIALALLLGAFLLALALLLCALVGVGFAQPALPLGLALLLAAALRLAPAIRRRGADPAELSDHGAPMAPPGRRHTPLTFALETIGWAALALVLGAAFVRSWTIPEAGWDAYSHWGLKAKLYFLAGTIVDAGTIHEYYPPLVPLLETWLYLHRGVAEIDEAKLVWAVVGSAFAVALAAHLREALRPAWTAPFAATAIVLTSAHWLEGMWTGQADLPLAAFFTLSILALFQWRQTGGPGARRWFALAVLFAGAAASTKYEGLFRVGVVAVALALDGLIRRGGSPVAAVAPAVGYLAGAGLLLAPWLAYRAVFGVAVHDEHIAGVQWQALPTVLRALWDTLAGLRAGGAWLLVLLAVVAGAPRLVRGPARLLALVVAGELAATVLGFLLTNGPPERQVYVTATRLLFHVAPAALFLATLALVPLLSPRESSDPPPPGPADARVVVAAGRATITGPSRDAH